MKLLPKTKYFFNIVLPFVLLFQGTLQTIEKKIYIKTNFSELTYDKCKDKEHSHPPLSQRETSNDRFEELCQAISLDLGGNRNLRVHSQSK